MAFVELGRAAATLEIGIACPVMADGISAQSFRNVKYERGRWKPCPRGKGKGRASLSFRQAARELATLKLALLSLYLLPGG